VLACAGDKPVSAVADELGISRATVAKWRSRFVRDRLAGLADGPRPGRPRTITDEHVEKVITATLRQDPPQGAAWSTRSMARQTGLSQTAVSRIWRTFGIQPQPAQAGPAADGRPGGTGDVQSESINDSVDAGSAVSVAEQGPAAEGVRPRRSGMLAAERRDQLLARLRRDGKLVARELAAELGLSEDSVRRDLRELAAAGLCQRVYGGALPVAPGHDAVQAARSKIAPESKRRVGARAAQFITPGSTVILDGGTTAFEVVAALPPDLDARITTHSATTAAALASHPKVSVLMLGGHLHKQSVSASGAMAAEAASRVSADVALLIITGIHPQQGLTVNDPEQAALLRILISRAADTYVMASVEKLCTVCAYRTVGLSEVAGIITDAPADHPTVRQLLDQGVTVIPAG
jgi:DeoR/GlpR family transcriptional regulator of sugar metabolism